MAHMWFMHDASLGRVFLFLEIVAENALLSKTAMYIPCVKYEVGMKLVMSYAKFPQAHAPLLANADTRPRIPGNESSLRRKPNRVFRVFQQSSSKVTPRAGTLV